MSPNAAGVATQNVTVPITPNDKGNPPGKLADAEIHFGDGVFAGLKLIGFAIWERRTGAGRPRGHPTSDPQPRAANARTLPVRLPLTICSSRLPQKSRAARFSRS